MRTDNYRMPDMIKTDRLTLCRLKPTLENAAMVWDAVNTHDTMGHLIKGGIYFPCTKVLDVAKMMASMNKLFKRGGFNYYLVKDKQIIGHINGEQVEDSNWVSLYYFLIDSAVGHGYMREALKAVENEHFIRSEDPLALYVFGTNERSFHTAKNMGYKVVQKIGDDKYMYRYRADWLKSNEPHRVCAHPLNSHQENIRSR